MKDRIEIDSREKKSAKKRIAFLRFFPRKARRVALAALRGQAAGGAPHPTPAMPAARAAARHFRRAGAGCRGALADARPCATNRMDHSIRDRAPKYPQIFPNFL
ncbi:hypothetical protein [Burkholderia pseudomallei]|uniref:hypothetical protein n=1 Tax=Burkholderia pseudomallei TaxID=28450 RepID=UPI001326D720|nr:hypothetical protein [Burkholderia pseudomallei]MBF3556054.1 hypothetical protein [Burkholderia pseudomallei]MVZ84743.1 hypothetical protein [Burkholderia pseudomallei]QTB57595.1 hypothetical protein J3E55_27645 [Burkholderia pseudomallei]